MDQWFEIVLDLLDEIYPTLDLHHAELKDIEKSIKEESDPLKRKRYLITDIHGRIFNGVPIMIVGTEVLFRLPMDPNMPGYEWWGPNDLNPEKYVSLTLDEKNEERYVVAKPFLSSVGLELNSQDEDEDEDEDNSSEKPCTSEIINVEGDKFGRMVFEPIDIYPYNTGGNQELFYLYEEPTKLDLTRLSPEFADIIIELMDEVGIYNPHLTPPNDALTKEENTQSREVKSPVIIRKKSNPLKAEAKQEAKEEPEVKAKEEPEPEAKPEEEPELEAKPHAKEEPEPEPELEAKPEQEAKPEPQETVTKEPVKDQPIAKPKIVLKIQPKSSKPAETSSTESPDLSKVQEANVIDQQPKEQKELAEVQHPREDPETREAAIEQGANTVTSMVGGQIVDAVKSAPLEKPLDAVTTAQEKPRDVGPTPEDFQGYQDPSAATLYTNEPEKEEPVLELTGDLQDTIELREGLSDGPIPSERYLFYPTQIRGYEWLNDNSPHPIRIKERSFPTVEHYVQFMKFFSGLEKEQRTDRKVLQEAYDKIVSSSAKDARALISNGGELRSKMVNYRDENWNRQKNKILYYGRIHKMFSNPNLRERLLRLKPYRIHHRVVSLPQNLPKKSWNTVLGGSVFYHNEENRWYGGVEKDVWEQIRDS